MQPENELDLLRAMLRKIREDKLGSYEKASNATGFNKNTIASYEKGLTLADIDFLFVFADNTGADLFELMRLRLLSSRYEQAREIGASPRLMSVLLGGEEKIQATAASAAAEANIKDGVFDDGGRGILEAVLRTGEAAIRNNKVTSHVIQAVLESGGSWLKNSEPFPDLHERMNTMVSAFKLLNTTGLDLK